MFRFGVDSDDENNDCEKVSDVANTTEKARFLSMSNPSENSEDAYDRLALCEGKVVLKKAPWTPPKPIEVERGGDNIGENAKMNGTEPVTTSGEVVAGIYEGGGKVWECAVDLVEYIAEIDCNFAGKRVLELGGGHCLPAVYAGMHGATAIDVQDLNEEVLRNVTATNLRMNVDLSVSDVRYVVGDWRGVPQLLQGGKSYDFIFSTETTYREADLMPLAHCILRLLKRNTGVAFVAGKSYYFGTGGGLRLFEEQLRMQASSMDITVVVDCAKEYRDGMSNIREILKIHARC